MRILLQGGTDPEALAVAAALRRGGLALAGEAEGFDLVVTLGGNRAPPTTLRVGPLSLDLLARRAMLGTAPLRLSPTEFSLLAALAEASRPLPRAALLQRVWGYAFDPGTNVVAVHVARLRAKLGPGLLLGGREGYRLAGVGG